MKIKRILIISDALIKPLYGQRMRFLCTYLHSKGVYIKLMTERFETLDFKRDFDIQEIKLYRYKNGIIAKIEWAIKNTLSLLLDYKNKIFTKRALQNIGDETFDLVCCSTFHSFGLRAGLQIARKKQIPYHVDLRDIAEQCDTNEYTRFNSRSRLFSYINKRFRNINITRRNKVLRQADCISSVSKWHTAFLKQFNQNIHLIYNGFDAEQFIFNETKTDCFTITYTGKWYSENLQDPQLLFEALKQIAQEHPSYKIKAVWYTSPDCIKRLKRKASKHTIEHIMEYHSYIPYEQVPSILNQSSIVLVLSNKGTNGIMTTKFFEALGVEKPILCVRSDEECLADTIKETNAGLAATNTEEVKRFILDKYNEWKTNGFTRQHIDTEVKRKFSRQYQAEQFLELFEQTIDLHNRRHG